MEDFKNIASDTFQSLLMKPAVNQTNEILGNITISSSLGLPVATSTEVRRKSGSHERLCDQTPYVERRLSAPLASSCSGESDSDPRRNLNFQDTVENYNETEKNHLEASQNESNVLQRRQTQNYTDAYTGNNQAILHKRLSPERFEDMTTRILASLEKEACKGASLEPGQEYITAEVCENSVGGFSRFIENEKLLSFASLEGHSSDDEIGDEDFHDDQLEAYFEQLIVPEMQMEEYELGEYIKAMELSQDQEKFQIPNVCQAARTDSPIASDEEVYGFNRAGSSGGVEQVMLPVALNQEVNELCKFSSRSGQNDSSGMSSERTACSTSEVLSRTTCSGALGGLDCGRKEGISLKMNAESKGGKMDTDLIKKQIGTSEDVCNKDVTNAADSELKLDSVYLKSKDDGKVTPDIWCTEQMSQFSDLCQVANENQFPLAEAYLSPYRGSEQQPCSGEEDLPHNVVYQNEEGRWVTDLAYYTSFDKEESHNFSNISGDFIAGSEAIAMIAQDEEEFEREHRFIQEEKIEPQSTSGLDDSSWKSVNYKSDFSKDANFLRLSLGEFFGQRSEALGCLGGDGDVKRPSFGYHITSPEKRQPVPLWRQSDISGPNSEQNSQISTHKGNGEDIKESSHTALPKLILGEIDIPTRDNRNEEVKEQKVESKPCELEPSLLSISTIASAIANASVSAEPSQLAALMLRLSNKTREGTNLNKTTQLAEFSVISHLLSSNVENTTFDIEKYLRRTEETVNDIEPESIIKNDGTASDWHTFLRKQNNEMNFVRDWSQSNLHINPGNMKHNLEGTHNANYYRDSPCESNSSKNEIGCLRAESNTDADFQPKKQTSTVPDSEQKLSERGKITLEDQGSTLSTYCELEGGAIKNTLPSNSKSVPVFVSPFPVYPKVNYQEYQPEDITKGSGGGNSDKHVTFENTSVDNQKILAEQKPATPSLSTQISDEEQYSFRPSTSPLTHSSPSESSGTATLGSDASAVYRTPSSKESCNSGTLPQSSVCSDPSLGRLTFVSTTEKALVLTSPEKFRSNRASQLSTTIVWTSPTSLLEQQMQKTSDLQNNKHPSLNPEKQEEKESTESTSKLEDPKSANETESKSKDKPAQISPNSNELGQGNIPVTQHTSVNAAHGLSLPSQKYLPSYKELGGCALLNQNRTNLKSFGASSEIETMPSGVPTLLTGCSLRTTPFAEHYLRSLTTHSGAALLQYPVSCPPIFEVPGGLAYSTLPVGRIQSSLMAGMTPAPDAGVGTLGTASHFNFTSRQNAFSNIPCTGQTTDVNCPRKWEGSVPFRFECVKVPEEVKFPNACCVGLTSHAVLSILNPSERWLQVNISLLSIMLDGEKVELLKHRCLLFKNKTVIGPCTTEELKMLFLPCQAGVFRCILRVASWPFSADADAIIQAEALAARVIVNAVAENPDIEVEAGRGNHLDFGDIPSGSWKALPLKLTNKTCARVPIRLVIHANAVAWRCFTLSKEPVNPSVQSALAAYGMSQLAAPSVVSHVMNASYNGQDPEALVVWVHFHAPSKCIPSDSLGPADKYSARVDVEVDCPEPANVLSSIPLHARSGTPRIYAPKGLQILYMSARIGLSSRQQLPLKNAGNIKVDLKMMILEPDSGISVKPEDMALTPGEEKEVTVEFSPKSYKNVESIVRILVLPTGPEYKVTVKGEVPVVENKPLVQKCPSTEVPPILANKQFLAWGGVQLDRTAQQKLILRNDSPSVTQQLRLLIRGQDQDCFQLKLGEHSYNNYEIKIRPKHDYNVILTFTPSRLACMFAKLEMKQLGVLSQLGIKFTIPLYGYGGKSNVRLENIKKHCNRYILGLYELSPDKTSQAYFSVQNTGSRAAYVKAICFKNFSERIPVDPKMIKVYPEKFVLKEGSQQKIIITCNFSEEQTNLSVLSTICLVYGDEISRQQYRRAIQCNPEQKQKILPANNPVVNVKFEEEFPGEEFVTEVYDLPQQSLDIPYFFTNMRRIIVSVVNSLSSTAANTRMDRSNVAEKSNMTLDMLPVKGPHGCMFSNNLDGNKPAFPETWTLQPESMILTVPSQSGSTITRHTQITNCSNRPLKFELLWPAHCLTVTPQHGTIDPESSISIHVSPNPSLAENKSMFPWSGLIYVHCDSVQKFVRVQIREGVSEKHSGRVSPVAKAEFQQQQPEVPIIHIRPLQKQSSTLEVKNQTVFFPETRSGERSDKCLEIENNGDGKVKWFLSSFAPPYVKCGDDSGEVYRATYTAFRCSFLSGTLEANGKVKVVVTFLPRDRGHYSQFWDLESHPLHEPHVKNKHRLQFCGVGILENEALKNEVSPAALVKVSVRDVSLRREYQDNFDQKIGSRKGIFTQQDVYTFPPTTVGNSSTLKISMRNYSTSSNRLKFQSPREPFCIKHSYYNLRSHHYCNLPVQFKPMTPGTFKSLLVIETDKSGTLTVQLVGEGLAEQ